MKLWLLRRLHERPEYDVNDGFVIRAKDEATARAIAGFNKADEGGWTWIYAENSTCEELSEEGEEAVILADFHAG